MDVNNHRKTSSVGDGVLNSGFFPTVYKAIRHYDYTSQESKYMYSHEQKMFSTAENLFHYANCILCSLRLNFQKSILVFPNCVANWKAERSLT